MSFDCISQEVEKNQLVKGTEIFLAAFNFFYCIERFFFEITVMHITSPLKWFCTNISEGLAGRDVIVIEKFQANV